MAGLWKWLGLGAAIGLALATTLPAAKATEADLYYQCSSTSADGATVYGWCPVNSTYPLPISGSITASLGAFAPTPGYATLTAAGSSARLTLPAGVTTVVYNAGTTTVSCTLGSSSSVTAAANEDQIPAGGSFAYVPGTATGLACIDQTGSTSNLVVASGGSGLPAGVAGSGGSSGGGGAVYGPTANGSAAANPPVLLGGTSNGTGTGTVENGKIDASGELSTTDSTTHSTLSTIATNTTNAGTPTLQSGSTTAVTQATGTNLHAVLDTTSTTAVTQATAANLNATVTPLAGAFTGCAGATIANTKTKPFSNAGSASNLLLVAGVASQNVHVCGVKINPVNGAVNVALVEGTTTTNACDTGTAGVDGGATAATGNILLANEGETYGNGVGLVGITATTADNVCMLFSGAVQVSGVITYAVF